MQAIKNALHSGNKEHSSTSSTDNTLDNRSSVGSTGAPIGSTTGDSAHSTLRDNTTSTGLGHATEPTGLAREAYADDSNTGVGRSSAGVSGLNHTTGHDHSIASKFDPTAENVTHDHKHLQHVVHKDHRHVEVEEVERVRDVDRHVHHVQHHVQPVIDKQVQPEVLHENAVPVTEIKERHSSTAEDRQLFQGLATQHRDEEVHRPKERTVVDLGEKVHENVHHHVHHVTQPVIEQEVVDRHRIHTVIPVHHTTHEAPIIHKSSTHEPVTMDSFLQGGGKLGSGITHHNAGVLQTEGCDRTVDGVGEKLAQDLHLGGSNYTTGSSTGTTTGATGLTGTHGVTGQSVTGSTTGDRI